LIFFILAFYKSILKSTSLSGFIKLAYFTPS